MRAPWLRISWWYEQDRRLKAWRPVWTPRIPANVVRLDAYLAMLALVSTALSLVATAGLVRFLYPWLSFAWKLWLFYAGLLLLAAFVARLHAYAPTT